MRGWQLLEKQGLFLYLQLHVVRHVLPHEDALKGHLQRHFVGASHVFIDEAHEVDVTEAARTQLLDFLKVAEPQLRTFAAPILLVEGVHAGS